MENAVIYARYSSDKQTEESIEAQVRACREYAERHGLYVKNVYADEAVSGKGNKTASRKQYQRLLRDCDKGAVKTILIHKYDRIARNLGEHVNLEARLKADGTRLVAVAQDFGTSSEAKIMRALMWSLSEYYIDNLASETRKGLRETALKGLHTGGYPPFGWDVVGEKGNRHYQINDMEAGYVRKIFDAAQSGEGFAALIEEMEAAGIKGKRGKPIRYPQIYEILRNEKYTGVYLYSPTEAVRRGDRRAKSESVLRAGYPPSSGKNNLRRCKRSCGKGSIQGGRPAICAAGLFIVSVARGCTASQAGGKGMNTSISPVQRNAARLWCIWRKWTQLR